MIIKKDVFIKVSKMRLFISINFNKEILDNISAVQNRLKKIGKGSFIPAHNFHLTLVFLGDVSQSDLDKVKSAMENVTLEKIHLYFEGTGVFRSSSGYIYWLGIRRNRNLMTLHDELCANLKDMGFNLENRKYKPHITLARRFRYGDHITDEKKLLLMEEKFKYTATGFSLMESKIVKGKVRYKEIYKVDVKNG